MLALAVGLFGTIIGLLRARQAETVASREAQTARRVTDLLTGMFEVADPYRSRGETITAREVLDRGVEQITGGLEGEPQVKATLLHTAGKVFQSLGLYRRNADLQRQAINLLRSNIPPSPALLAASLEQLGRSQIEVGDFRAAQSALEEALTLRQALNDAPSTRISVVSLADAHIRQGQLDPARSILDRYLSELQESGQGNSVAAGHALSMVGNIHTRRNELAQAKASYERSNEILRPTLRPGDIPGSHNNLAIVYYYLGDYPAAERINREVLAYRLQRYGPDHQIVAYALDNLGEVMFKQGRFREAADHHQRALDVERKGVGETPDMGLTIYNLGLAQQAMGALKDAEHSLRESLRIRLRFHPSTHPEVAASEAALGSLLGETSRRDEAVSLLRNAHAKFEKALGAQHPDTLGVAKKIAQLDSTTR